QIKDKSMSCQIIRYPSTGKIKEVLAENGKPSILYRSLKKIIPSSIEPDIYVNDAFKKGFIKDFSKEEVALALWSKVYTPEFKEWFGKSQFIDNNREPLLTDVENDITDQKVFRNGNNQVKSAFNHGTFM